MSGDSGFDALSRRLAKLDFSAESRVRESLRARLLAKKRSAGFGARPPAARAAPLALALLALLLLLPHRAKLGAPARNGAGLPRDELGLPILPGRLPAGASGGEAPLIVVREIDGLIELHAGRVVPTERGSAVLWEHDGESYVLETRRISTSDLFEKPAL